MMHTVVCAILHAKQKHICKQALFCLQFLLGRIFTLTCFYFTAFSHPKEVAAAYKTTNSNVIRTRATV